MIDTMSDTPLGLTEIGELLGVSRQRAFTLSKRADFPPPTATLKAGRIWDRATIEAWASTWDRSNQGGRPKQKKAAEHAPPEPEPEPADEEGPPAKLGIDPRVTALSERRLAQLAAWLGNKSPEWYANTVDRVAPEWEHHVVVNAAVKIGRIREEHLISRSQPASPDQATAE